MTTAPDPAHPFTVAFSQMVAQLETSLREGVEAPQTQSFRFEKNTTTYVLAGEAVAITQVSGLSGSVFRVFKQRSSDEQTPGDYHFDGDQGLVWTEGAARPSEGTIFDVEYTVREEPAGITDLRPGSVAGTLVRAVAREFTQMYAQMDEAYRRAFIDVATGAALDNVVALVGVVRHAPQPAEGEVTFTGKADAVIPKGTRITDASGRVFITQEEKTISKSPPPPAGSKTPAPEPGVAVPIEAAEPGPDGNVNKDTIKTMPRPPRGVSGVSNAKQTTGGQEAEPDDSLRSRAKQALEGAARGTLGAIRSAVLALPGIEGCNVADHVTDPTIPLGEVQVFFAGDADLQDAVSRAVEGSRAAGIRAVVHQSPTLTISGAFTLVPSGEAPEEAAAQKFIARVTEFLHALPMGTMLSLSRLNALAFESPGLASVSKADLTFVRSEGGVGGAMTEPFPTLPHETIVPGSLTYTLEKLP